VHQVGDQPRLYYDARPVNHQDILIHCLYHSLHKAQSSVCPRRQRNVRCGCNNLQEAIQFSEREFSGFFRGAICLRSSELLRRVS